MKLHEYQSKQIFFRYGIPIPIGHITDDPLIARQLAEELGGRAVIKAQVLVGGRGKVGGIRVANSAQEAEEISTAVLKMTIKDLPVKKVLVDEVVGITKEIYLGITVDRSNHKPVMMSSAAGGGDIEEVARNHPEKMIKVNIDPMLGLLDYQAREFALAIDLPRDLWGSFLLIAKGLWQVYRDCDATLAEINPLVINMDHKLIALDGKIDLDDNALFRHSDLVELRNAEEDTPAENEARKYGVTYIKLNGQIGCLVNGAGLAMATMDLIKMHGGEPSNFLDIGGGASADRVAAALRLILDEPKVRVVLINIFGGITRCDEVARGILAAMDIVKPDVPMVVRLIGTNAAEGRQLLSKANLITANTLTEAAQKAVSILKGDMA